VFTQPTAPPQAADGWLKLQKAEAPPWRRGFFAVVTSAAGQRTVRPGTTQRDSFRFQT